MASTRPLRKIIPTAKLTADNAGDLELPSHRRAIAIASATVLSTTAPPSSSPLPESSPPPQSDTDNASSPATEPSSPARLLAKRPSQALTSTPSLDSIIIISPTTSDDGHAFPDPIPKAKKTKLSAASGDEDTAVLPAASIILIDDIEDPHKERLNKSDPTADIKQFFTLAPRSPGQSKRRMKCILCA
jgi:hypothetical protein